MWKCPLVVSQIKCWRPLRVKPFNFSIPCTHLCDLKKKLVRYIFQQLALLSSGFVTLIFLLKLTLNLFYDQTNPTLAKMFLSQNSSNALSKSKKLKIYCQNIQFFNLCGFDIQTVNNWIMADHWKIHLFEWLGKYFQEMG